MNTITHTVPLAESSKLDRITAIGMELERLDKLHDWTEAVALAVDAYEAGVRPAKDAPLLSSYRILAEFNPGLWSHLTMRKTAVKAFVMLLNDSTPFEGAPV